MKSPQKKSQVNSVLDSFLGKSQDKAERYLKTIELMLDEDKYQFASDTLRGIYESIERNGSISDRQAEAVDNINSSV